MSSKSARPYTSILLLLLVLLISGANPAFALPRDPLDPEPIDEPGGGDFQAPPGGFAWSVPSRFGLLNGQNMVDYRWDPASATYAQSYVNPAEFPMNFDGCPTQAEADAQEGSTTNTYRWEIPARGVNQLARNCRFAHTFAAQDTYEVKLTITPPQGTPTTHTQNVVVKDWLIVSIGDSYGSGEGNPDQPQQFDGFGFVSRGARWIDRRCHRSATAGPAQAARAIEQYDFKTSVTFLSFACSGATIDTPIYTDPNNSATFQGSGVLGSYRGVQPDDPNNYDQSTYLPAQIDALARTLAGCAPTDASAECASRTNGRQVDALIISAGGNDLHFANIIADCVWHNMPRVFGTGGRCHEQPAILDRLAQDLDAIDEKYDALANAIANPDPAGRPRLSVRDVYVTEYPDPTQDDDGSVCGSMLGEILPTTPFDVAKIHIDADESRWAAQNVVGALNEQIRLAAERHANKGWHHVTGISSQFATHGYCADGHWIVQAYESARIQGPIWGTTTEWGPILFVELGEQKGTMHPNEWGHRAYANRIRPEVTQRLQGGPTSAPPPNDPLPAFSITNAAGSTTAVEGSNGWLTDRAVLTVTASDATRIRGASVSTNGTAGCAVSGLACTAALNADGSYTWSFNATGEGVYNLEFTAKAHDGQVANFTYELKVDFHDPTATATTGTAPNGAGWYRTPVDVTFDGSDPGTGSGVTHIEYRVNGVLGTAVPGGAVTLAADGVHTITYQAVDQAGRMSPVQTLTVKIDQTAPGITLTTPANTTYSLNQIVPASYTCTDDGSGAALCAGTVANGSNVDTGSTGVKSFTVNAADNAGNTASQSVSYNVAYRICALYDQTRPVRSGSTMPIKIQLCDANDANVSSASIAVNALKTTRTSATVDGPVQDSGNANPDQNFRYDASLGGTGGYIYNLSTRGMATGTYTLSFQAGSDTSVHAVRFEVK